jgi:hypothetical protein
VSAVKHAPDAETARRLTVSLTPQPRGPVTVATAFEPGKESRPIPAGSISINLLIRVPRRAHPRIQVWKGQVKVDGVDNGAEVRANRADIDFRHVSGEISSETAVGRQQFDELVNANIDAQSLEGDMALHVVRGDSLRALAHDGAVVAREIRFKRISIGTIRGDIHISGEFAPGGSYELRSLYGDVEVEIAPTKTPFRVRGYSRDGQVSFPDGVISHLDEGTREVIAVSVEPVTRSFAQLELRSRHGNIRLASIQSTQ